MSSKIKKSNIKSITDIARIIRKFFNINKYPTNYYKFLLLTCLFWFIINLGLNFLFAIIYYYYDKDNEVSVFYGGIFDCKKSEINEKCKKGKTRDFREYFFISTLIGTVIGLGDVNIRMYQYKIKLILVIQVMLSLFLNFFFISFKELKLADDP